MDRAAVCGTAKFHVEVGVARLNYILAIYSPISKGVPRWDVDQKYDSGVSYLAEQHLFLTNLGVIHDCHLIVMAALDQQHKFQAC